MAVVGQQLTAPEAGWKRYDDRHPAIKYFNNNGEWTSISASAHYSSHAMRANKGKNSKFQFLFIGTKVMLIIYADSAYSKKIRVSIDGTDEFFDATVANGYQIVGYIKEGLPNTRHFVEVQVVETGTSSTVDYIIDAIDIDDTGRLFHPDEVTNIHDLEIGKRIRCHYSATSNQVGVFSNLGKEVYVDGINDFIPPTSSATPNGCFYYIMVDRDRKGDHVLVADRNIQSSISWDELNTKGVASGSGIETPLVEPWEYIKNQHLTVSGQWMTRIDHGQYDGNFYYRGIRYPKGRSSGKWYYEVSSVKTGSSQNWFRAELGVADKSQSLTLNNTTSPAQLGWDYHLSFHRNSDVYSYGETIGVMIDLDEKKLHLYQDGVIIDSLDGLPDGELHPFIAIKDGSGIIVNLGIFPFKYNLPKGYSPYEEQWKYLLTTRLLTGGISSSDKDNEWDKYIVNSTLNNTITAGDNSVWNWSGIYSWTSSTTTSRSDRRTIRGSASVGSFNNYAVTSNTTHGFRPVLLFKVLGAPKFSGGVDRKYVHKGSVNLIGTLTIGNGHTVSYKVLLNGQVIYQVDDYLATHDINVQIPSSSMSIGSNIIELVATDDENESTSWVYYVMLVNSAPVITATMQGLALKLSISDPDFDKVQFRVELNGVQVFPSSGFTNLLDTPIFYQHTFKSSDVNIRSTNTVTIYAIDDVGEESTQSITFVGDYSGLMFADAQGNFYSTDLGEVLQYLDFGAVIAGQTTLSVPIRLINKNGFKVTNIVISNDNNSQQPGTRLEMSKSDLPFTPEDVLVYSNVLDYGDEVTFYVRLATDIGTSPRSGKVTIFVKGDPIE